MGSAWNSTCDRSRLYCFNGLQWFFAVARVWTSALGSDACLSHREVSRGAAINYPETWFILWLQAVIVLDIGSLILDTANVVRYYRGEQDEMVEGLS